MSIHYVHTICVGIPPKKLTLSIPPGESSGSHYALSLEFQRLVVWALPDVLFEENYRRSLEIMLPSPVRE